MYKDCELEGGHIIKLGGGNDAAAKEALQVWPGAFQIGGGMNDKNAKEWLDAGAGKVSIREHTMRNCSLINANMSQVIMTSYLFPGGKFSLERLQATASIVGKERLVVDVRYLSSFLTRHLAN